MIFMNEELQRLESIPVYEFKIERVLFKDNEESFKIYSLSPTGEAPSHVKLSGYGNFVAKGDVPLRNTGDIIQARIGDKTIDHMGRESYELLQILAPSLDTLEEQDTFLEKILTESQFKRLKDAFPEEKLVDFIKDGKLKPGMIKGIGAHTIEKIEERILENQDYALLITLLKGYGFSLNRFKSILQYFKGDSDEAYKVIKDNVYELAKIDGWGFLTVDNQVLSRGIPYSPEKRISSAVISVLNDEVNNGNTWESKVALLQKVGALTSTSYENIIEVIEKEEDVIRVGERFALKHIIFKEAGVFKELERINNNAETVDLLELEKKINYIEEQQGFKFTDEQKEGILNAHSCGVSIITGGAGTGKSSTIKGIAYTTPELNYSTMALSGRAVDVIVERDVNSTTIHRGVGINHSEGASMMYNIHTNKITSALDVDVIIIDEFSMVDVSLYYELLTSIPDGTRLVLVGDIGQLPAIGYGDVARDLIETDFFPVVELNTIHRQAQESGIINLAYMIRNGEPLPALSNATAPLITEQFGVNKDATAFLFEESSGIPYVLVQYMKKHQKTINSPYDLLDFQIITPLRSKGALSVNSLNQIAQNIYNPYKKGKKKLVKGAREFRVDDKIMVSGNSYDIPVIHRSNYTETGETTNIYNGSVGVVIDIINKSLIIDFPREKGYTVFENEEINNIDLSYVATVHKLQGSSAKEVVVAVDMSSYIMLSRQLLYVAITRAEESVIVFAEKGAFKRALETDASEKRKTFLKDFISQARKQKEE